MTRLLSTKVLSPQQLDLLPAGDFHLQQYDALVTEYLPADLHSDDEALCLFTSQHAVRACFPEGRPGERMLNCCCVGAKTAALLQDLGHRVLEVRDSAKLLADEIVKKYSGRSFIFFCGDRRLGTLPKRLKAAGISLEERVVYHTRLNVESFDTRFDAVFFFSPSGVKSFTAANDLSQSTAICIGPTTAKAARKYTEQIITAAFPSVEAVLTAAGNLLKTTYEPNPEK